MLSKDNCISKDGLKYERHVSPPRSRRPLTVGRTSVTSAAVPDELCDDQFVWSFAPREQNIDVPRHDNSVIDESLNCGDGNNGDDNADVSSDQERQLLLLMLLAQVCALHDPTPRTFTVHVLALFERGILDRESIRFLFDLGLVPAASSPTNLLSFEPPPVVGLSDLKEGHLESPRQTSSIPKWTRDIIPVAPALDRAREASTIRFHLQRHETKEVRSKKIESSSTSDPPVLGRNWKVENHPLYLSRYQREFTQVRLLAAGSFGQVFQATSKLDGRDYAIKRVAFAATGYSNESITQVIREVRCLAHCDHPNCVRYYTSWLEPSWMTGSGTTIAPDHLASKQVQQKLLTDLNHLVMNGEDETIFSQSQKSYALDCDELELSSSSCRHRRRCSYGGSNEDSIESLENSRYNNSSVSDRSKDDSFVSWGYSDVTRSQKARKNGSRQQSAPPKSYRYQICLFIQMQLCLPTTLADWIRKRNQSSSSHDHAIRIGPALDIVTQLISGIAHVHAKDIIHRDLKPGNIFAGNDGTFLIGDFGLSKLIQSAEGEEPWDVSDSNRRLLLATAASKDVQGEACVENPLWHEPLTAGVGTASYAAPEQVASVKYGPGADIFSLGLIMLELVCCFDTEHERIQTFQDCRRGKLPSWLASDYPPIASLILRCTDKHPNSRPSAMELLSCNLTEKQPSIQLQETMDQLIEQLKEKDDELEQQKIIIAEKDRIIAKLQRQMERRDPGYAQTLLKQSIMGDEDLMVAVDASYSSDDDY